MVLDRINPRDVAGVDPGGSNARLQEAERSLTRSKRDLAEAVGNARRLEQRVAEARRRLEQWRWINAGTGDPELAREAAIRVTMQTAAIETEEKFASDVAARITRLKSRVERQATRVSTSRRADGMKTWMRRMIRRMKMKRAPGCPLTRGTANQGRRMPNTRMRRFGHASGVHGEERKTRAAKAGSEPPARFILTAFTKPSDAT